MDYTEVVFTITPKEPTSEILIAELGELGFEMFVDHETGISAYIPNQNFDVTVFDEISILKSNLSEVSYSYSLIKDQNWNKEWEKNFHAIEVDNTCIVRAPFHSLEHSFRYDLIIEPKMSFGTGHHETTYLVLKEILTLEFENLRVLDMGCGTAVLGILASKKGAESIVAIDIDDWAVENSIENAARNACDNIQVLKGDAHTLKDIGHFDVVFANINRNILLRDMEAYSMAIHSGGKLILSGFFTTDADSILDKASSMGFKIISKEAKNNWSMLHLKKIG